MNTESENKFQSVNRKTQDWRQGDCFLGNNSFYTVVNPQCHISTDQILDEDEEIIGDDVAGYCIVTQTCDIARDCQDRPFLEVCPLVEVDESQLDEIKNFKRPNYGYIPNLAERKLVADLDRTMTIEKSFLLGKDRIQGLNNDKEVRLFAKSLSRKRSRFAFPNDFVTSVQLLLKRWNKKYKKGSEEGESLRKISEIRVMAYPSWDDPKVDVTFLFITDKHTLNNDNLDKQVEGWINLLMENERFNFSGYCTSLDIMTAQEYLESDPLDLDSLTISYKTIAPDK